MTVVTKLNINLSHRPTNIHFHNIRVIIYCKYSFCANNIVWGHQVKCVPGYYLPAHILYKINKKLAPILILYKC